MSWEIVGIIMSNSLAAAALGWSIYSERRANASVGLAESAEERSATALETMALSIERQAAERERLADRPGATWTLRHFDGDTYVWEQTGRGIAYDVQVVAPELVLQARDLPDVPGKLQRRLDGEQGDPLARPVVETGGYIRFLTVRTLGTRDDTVTISWSDEPDGVRRTFARPLPPRPPRRKS